MLQPSTAASKRKKKKKITQHSFVPSASVSWHSLRTIRKRTIAVQVAKNKLKNGSVELLLILDAQN